MAALSTFNHKLQNKLFSCMKAQGVCNDIMTITIVRLAYDFYENHGFYWYTPIAMCGLWILIAFLSSLIAFFFAFGSCYLFKKMKFLNGSAITETFLMFASSMLSYYTCDALSIVGVEFFGIMALSECALIHSHYTWYNFSPQGKATSSVIMGFLGAFSEGIMYAYIGIAFYIALSMYWSVGFIFLMLIIVIALRFVTVLGLHGLTLICRRD